jgi:LacI family transcriptional regulator
VVAAAEELGYVPSSVARQLRGSARGPVGLYVDNALVSEFEQMPRLFAHRLVRHISDGLAQRGFGVLHVREDPDADLALLLVISDLPVESFWTRSAPGVPIVVAGHQSSDPAVVANLQHDHEAYSLEVVEHLLAGDARHLAILRHSLPGAYNEITCQTLADTARDAGLLVEVHAGEFDPRQCEELAARAVRDGADAVFSMLPLPRSVLAGITSTGARVPEDVLLVGRTEGVVEAQTQPPVSVLSMQAIGCAELLLDTIDKALSGQRLVDRTLPHRLIVRESSIRR